MLKGGTFFNRVKREHQEILKEPISHVSIGPVGDDMREWQATIIGPKGSDYEDGLFKLKIELPPEYPFKPPRVYFVTRVYHPNINSNGSICLDVLHKQWSPAFTLTKMCLMISALLCDPNPDDPLVPEIAMQYKSNRSEFSKRCKQWTYDFAIKPYIMSDNIKDSEKQTNK
ncbi:MAG: Ubiquitin-conjugating enzyme E2 D4 [Marteilia pararefringens]